MLKKKKNYILPLLFFLTLAANAQPQLGVEFSPSFVFNRIKMESEDVIVSNNGAGLRPEFGLIAEFPIADMYSFSTGITYLSKSLKMIVDPANGGSYSNKYSLQYIQVPLTVKLFTNEISIDKRLYFQTGFQAEIMVYNENKSGDPTAIRKFNFIDFPLVFEAGIEMNVGVTTVVFGGIHYHRGLINASSKENFSNSQFSVKNDIAGVTVGVKF